MVEPTTFAELLAYPGVEELCTLRSKFGFLAFHGGASVIRPSALAFRDSRK